MTQWEHCVRKCLRSTELMRGFCEKLTRWCPSRKTSDSGCILGGTKESYVEWVEWLRETKRAAHSPRCRLGIPALWQKALAAVHGWARHLASKTNAHPRAAVVQWRNPERREIMKHTCLRSTDQTWRHQQNIWTQSFENALVKAHGVGWRTAAEATRGNWQNQTQTFIRDAL